MGGGDGRGGQGDAERLLRRRRTLEGLRVGASATGALDIPQQGPGGDISTYDNHPADLGTDTWQREQSLGLSADLGAQVAEVDAALERIREGTYGWCEACGDRIPEARLEVLPEARRCVRCQKRRDAMPASYRGGRPAEEAVLAPPFGRTFRDAAGDAGFDGDDSFAGPRALRHVEHAFGRAGGAGVSARRHGPHGAVEDVGSVAAAEPDDQAEAYDVNEDDR